MRKANAPLAAKLEELAVRHLGREGFALAAEKMKMYLATGDRGYLQGGRPAADKPPAAVKDLSKADTPDAHGREIIRLIQWCRKYKDPAYLTAARRQARLAYVRFMDDSCPLPKAYSGSPRKTVAGEAFGDFYFKGAKLMHAFALVGEAEGQTRRLRPAAAAGHSHATRCVGLGRSGAR